MKNRYLKQELCSFIGSEGQQRIRDKHVLIIGVGALGSASAEMLVRSGIGALTIIDRDYVELSNLQRQQLYSEEDAKSALPKVIAARYRLSQINSDVQITAIVMDVRENNLQPFLKDIDVIIDATDNFDIRFILNDLAHQWRIPFIFAASKRNSSLLLPFFLCSAYRSQSSTITSYPSPSIKRSKKSATGSGL